MLYERTFSTLRTKIIADGDMFVCTHDVFCKFADAKGFNVDLDPKEWSNKTHAASDLYQSALDEAQNFVTLGQIRQTIDKLMSDIATMKCGELTRIMNHLYREYRTDENRCKAERKKYVEWLKDTAEDNDDDDENDEAVLAELDTQLSIRDDDGDRNGIMRNPGLSFKHISKNKWIDFLKLIAANFKMNIPSTELSKTVVDLYGDEEEEDEKVESQQNEQMDNGKTKKIIESILDNTNFDIIRIHRDEQKYEEPTKYEDQKKKKTRTNKKRGEVFDTIISFCASRITLQQLFQFSKLFKRFLCKHSIIDEMMKEYDESIKSTTDNAVTENLFKKTRIPATFEQFVAEYFNSEHMDGWDAETNYLFLGCENKYDLCHKIYPFWSASIIVDIYKLSWHYPFVFSASITCSIHSDLWNPLSRSKEIM